MGALRTSRERLRTIVTSAFLALAAFAIAGCRDARATAETVNDDEGAALFASTCARCHGERGRGGLPLYDGGPAPRDLSDHTFHAGHTDADLHEIITKGKSTGMPPFAGAFTDAQMKALVKHLRSLDSTRAP